jgi:diguanylate cyclase (GGDEF)-like protein/PAS domain S-box-containing protein
MLKLRLPLLLISSLITVQAITAGCMVWNSAQLIEVDQRDLLQRFARTNSALLAKTLAPSLADDNRFALLDTLESLSRNYNLRYAAVFNSRRELLASLGEPPLLAQDLTRDLAYRAEQIDGLFIVEYPITVAGNILGVLQTGFGTPDIGALFSEFKQQNGLIALAGLLVSTVLIAAISLPVSRSLSRIQAGLIALKEGEWGHRIQSGKRDDTAAVVKLVNGLATQQEASWDEMRRKYERLFQKSRQLSTLLHGINAVVWNVDPREGRFIYVSEEAERLLGYPMGEWLKADFCERYIHPSDLEWVRGFITHPGTTPMSFTLDFRIFNSANECIWLRMISSVEIREQASMLVGLLLDVTEEKRNEQRMAYLADHDPLTGLINRRRFQERLEEQIIYNTRYNAIAALLFIDLDQFKYINDYHGHHTGDEYLRQVAHHLRRSLRKSDIIGRLGGDEFGIILGNTDADQARQASENLLKHLNRQEFIHDDRRVPFSASIGIALFPEHGENASDLLAKADSAMYTAKEQGRNTYRTFEEGTDIARMQEQVEWEERIHHALKHNRFQLYFQPIVDINSGFISHYESLLRMLGDNDKIIAPGAFIGIAERFGMIREIDCWVVANAIRAQGASMKTGKPKCLTINLSGRHFGSTQILEVIEESTKRHGAEPSHIVFEVTETAAVENFTEACRFIQSLRSLGYRFALDDFGVGFSSFDYLKNIPVDYIKIDGSFVRNLSRDQFDQIFVRAISDMARSLGVKAIAEFVEDQEALEMLRELGVPLGQGFFFAKPQPRFHDYDRLVFPSREGL